MVEAYIQNSATCNSTNNIYSSGSPFTSSGKPADKTFGLTKIFHFENREVYFYVSANLMDPANITLSENTSKSLLRPFPFNSTTKIIEHFLSNHYLLILWHRGSIAKTFQPKKYVGHNTYHFLLTVHGRPSWPLNIQNRSQRTKLLKIAHFDQDT